MLQHGYLCEHDAAEIMRDIIGRHQTDELNWKLEKYHQGLVSIDSIATRENQSIGEPFQNSSSCHTPHYNWAFGVLLYVMLCGPPRNNDPLWYIRFYNGLQMGVQVVPSRWFGSPSNRRKWKELEVRTKHVILRLIHSESEMYIDAYETDVEWSNSLNNNLQGQLKSATLLKTVLFKQPCPMTKDYRQFIFDEQKVLCGPVCNAITEADNDEKADTRSQWDGFWSKTARNEKKKRRKPLTVAEARERKIKKIKTEIIHRMNSLDKPVVPLMKKLKEMDA